MAAERSGRSPSRGALPTSTVGLATLFLLVCWGVGGGEGMPRGPPPPPQFQDPASVSTSEEWSISELAELLANAEPQERERKLANLLEWMHQLRQQHQDEAMAAAIESEVTGNARMALPPPLLHSVSGPRGHPVQAAGGEEDGDDDGKGKRGSFMSLCHFKICNMGRKRNLRYNPWSRA